MKAEQGDLFNPVEGRRRRDEGFDRLAAHTPDDISTAMWQVWRHVCETQSEVTSDDFWNACPVELRQVIAHRGNTVGKMINESAQRRWITPTGRSTKTARPSGNRRAISVWRSLVVTYGNH